VAAILLLPTAGLAVALGLVTLLAAWEWTALAGIEARGARLTYLALIGACLLLLWVPPPGAWLNALLLLLALWWWGAAFVLFRMRVIAPAQGLDAALLPAGVLVLAGPWLAIVHLHAVEGRGPWLVLFLFVLIWAADTAAYFVGRQWGRAKLAPVLSPGKTRAGVYGALAGAGVCGLMLGRGLGLTAERTAWVIGLCIVTAFISVVGDLYESLLKRRRGFKDSGKLLPGHGGVLDRIDSLTAAAPLFTLGMLWLEVQL
jgi:phosphatidate cytidylyltransferase